MPLCAGEAKAAVASSLGTLIVSHSCRLPADVQTLGFICPDMVQMTGMQVGP